MFLNFFSINYGNVGEANSYLCLLRDFLVVAEN